MELDIKYRGKIATTEDVAFINKLISENPDDSRWRLSKKLCEAWNWVQPNGALRDMVARGFMLELHRAGYIKLPPKKRHTNNPLKNRKKPESVEIDTSSLNTALKKIRPLEFHQVRRTPSEKLFNSLMNEHHYLSDQFLTAKGLRVHLAYTRLLSQNLTAGAASGDLQYRPRNKASLSAGYGFGNGISGQLSLLWIGKQAYFSRTLPQQEAQLPAYTLVNLKLDKRIPGTHSSLYIGADNLLDKEYETSYGFPQAGRFVYAGIRYAL